MNVGVFGWGDYTMLRISVLQYFLRKSFASLKKSRTFAVRFVEGIFSQNTLNQHKNK